MLASLSILATALACASPPAPPPYLECERFPGPAGVDDIAVDGDRLILSAQERVAGAGKLCSDESAPWPAGGLYSLDTTGLDAIDAEAWPEAMETWRGGDPEPLHPQGIALTSTDDGEFLYVVNEDISEGCSRQAIEKFRVAGNRLELVDRYAFAKGPAEFPKSRSANDLVALADGRLYVTFPRNIRKDPLGYFGRGGHDLVWRMSGEGVRWFGTPGDISLRFANGIAHDASRHRLYVADSARQEIRILQLGKDGTPIYELAPIGLGSSPDNLSWSADRRTLYAAAHPSAGRFLRHGCEMESGVAPAGTSPSEVYAVHLGGEQPRVERIFYDSGSRVPGVSVAVVANGDLYLGQVYESGIWRCRLSSRAAHPARRRIRPVEPRRETPESADERESEPIPGEGVEATGGTDAEA